MTAIHETAYPRLNPNVPAKEVKRIYTPTNNEWRWVRQRRMGRDAYLGQLVYLKCFQRLGYFPKEDEIPPQIIEHIAECHGLPLPGKRQPLFSSEKAGRRAKEAIREYCGVRKFEQNTHGDTLQSFAQQMAHTKASVIDILNAMVEWLVKECFELPAFSSLERMAIEARAAVNSALYLQCSAALSPKAKLQLDKLLKEKNEDGVSLWELLKIEPHKPSSRTLQIFLRHSQWINTLKQHVGTLPDIPEERRYQLLMEAKAYNIDRMREIKDIKRWTLLSLLVCEQYYFATDCIVEMLVKEVRKLHNRGRSDLKEFQKNAVKESESLVTLLKDVALIVQDKQEANTQINNIQEAFQHDPAKIIKRCDRLVLYGMNNHLQFLAQRYTDPLRKVLLDCLSMLQIQRTAPGDDLMACLAYVLQYRDASIDLIPVKALDANDPANNKTAVDWISQAWSKLLFEDTGPRVINRVMRRKYFELAVLSECAQRLLSGDLYVLHSVNFDDYRNHLVSWEVYEEQIDEFAEQLGIDPNAARYIERLKNDFLRIAAKADQRFPKDSYVTLEDGQLSLKKWPSPPPPAELKKLNEALRACLPEINIVDLLVDTVKWVPMKNLFGPLSGLQSKLRNYDKRLVASLFCYGCNLGPAQTARSLKGFSRRQIALLNLEHIHEQNLEEAIKRVVNTYNQYELPGYWGTGDTASVDGTHFDMYDQNLLSEYHIRYASYGGIGYYVVSDKYIALCSRFISCSVREAFHLIDCLMENTSDIQPHTVHGDTHAQSTVVFGLASLLGIKLMPRIRDVNSLVFFKPDRRIRYDHIDDLFGEGIDFNLIKLHLRDMLRVAMSIKLGKVSASTIIRRLGTEGVRNQLFYAFRELGRCMRTMFLLEYITDIEMRETINAATCKSEEFNQFLQWVFFYDKGIIQENLRAEQSKIIKYNHLVANLIVLHNVNAMTRAFRKLKREGHQVTSELLKLFSPFRGEHINRLGSYPLNTNKRTKARQFKLFL